ncbi:MAG: elongation factor P, partial [Bacteroidota bacterium]
HAEMETPLTCDLPAFVEMEVAYVEPGIKGDTASTSAQKPATLSSGLIINVPLFIEQGDVIKIDTRDVSYYERVKK